MCNLNILACLGIDGKPIEGLNCVEPYYDGLYSALIIGILAITVATVMLIVIRTKRKKK